MAIENEKYDVDVLLKKALGSSEKPNPALVDKLKNDLLKEKTYMKEKKFNFKKSSIAAIALVATLSFATVAFAQPVWQYLQTRVVEGSQYIEDFNVMQSEDGGTIISSVKMAEDSEDGRVVVEVEGEQMVLIDPLVLDDLDEALALFRVENPMLPTYLPEGFAFESAKFPVNPIDNPTEEAAGMLLFITYGDGANSFTLIISYNEESWGLSCWAEDLEEITINGYNGLIGAGGLNLQCGSDTSYLFIIQDTDGIDSIDLDELVKVAESLR